jgi:DtxR family transcriptional regulator, Mn-dependent transcriptional regulator
VISESIDDYLKAILELGGAHHKRVATNELAARLGVRNPSVTGMLQKLSLHRPPLVMYQKHRGVQLTEAGKRRAWELVRHHRLLELFLHDVLRYSWDEVHDEAERLEHFISERFEDRVSAILGNPEFDPHGHAIPRKDESGIYRDEVTLAEWPLSTSATISSVSDRSAESLRKLKFLGLIPGAAITVEHRGTSGLLSVRLDSSPKAVRVHKDLAVLVRVGNRS